MPKCEPAAFNPWIGEFESGLSFDSATKLNPWHDQRLAELHSLTDISQVPSSFRNIYTNYVEGEFASKLWQSESTFNVAWNVDPQVLQCSWGVNLRYGASYPHDWVPATFADLLTSSTQTGHDHSINNFLLYPVINIQNPYLYIKGPHIIASAEQYLFPNHDPVYEHAYLWTHVDESLQLHLFTDSARTDDDYKFNFVNVDYVGGTTIQPTGVVNSLTNLLYQLIQAPGGIDLYYITTNTGMYAYFPSSQITTSFKRARQPPHLAIEWKTFEQFNATSRRDPYKWHISPASYLHNSRRLLDPTDYDALWQLKENDVNKQFVIQSSFIDLSSRYLMTQAHESRPGLVYWGSNNQQMAGGGISWKIEYDPVILKFRLLNIDSNTYLNSNIQRHTRTWGVAGDTSTISDVYTDVSNPSIDLVHVTGDTYRLEDGGGEYILTINHGHAGDPLEPNYVDTWGTSDELLWINKENNDWQSNYVQPPYWYSWSNDFIIRERSSIDPGVSTLP